jgi:hypothetical protein
MISLIMQEFWQVGSEYYFLRVKSFRATANCASFTGVYYVRLHFYKNVRWLKFWTYWTSDLPKAEVRNKNFGRKYIQTSAIWNPALHFR